MTLTSAEFDPDTTDQLQWLDKYSIVTNRDAAILRLLDRNRAASLNQICRIWSVKPTRARQRLYELIKHGIIQYVEFDGTRFRPSKKEMIRHGLIYNKSIYTITRLGQAWLNKYNQGPPGRTVEKKQLIHDLLLTEVMTRLAESVHRLGQGWRYDWYGEQQAGKLDRWPSNLGVLYGPQNSTLPILPVFIHIEMSQTGGHVLRDSPFATQISSYEEVIREWTSDPLLQTFPYFPAVLWVVDADEKRLQNLATSLHKRHHSFHIGYALARRDNLFAGQDILTTRAWILLPAVKPTSLIGFEPNQRQSLLNKFWLNSLLERNKDRVVPTDRPAPVGLVIPADTQPASPPPPPPLVVLPPERYTSTAAAPAQPSRPKQPVQRPVTPARLPQAAPKQPPSQLASSPASSDSPAVPPPTSEPVQLPETPATSFRLSPAEHSQRLAQRAKVAHKITRKLFNSIPAPYGTWRSYPLGIPSPEKQLWRYPIGEFILTAIPSIDDLAFFVALFDELPPWEEWLVTGEDWYKNQAHARHPANQGIVALLPDEVVEAQQKKLLTGQSPGDFKLWVTTQADFLASPNVLNKLSYYKVEHGASLLRGPMFYRPIGV